MQCLRKQMFFGISQKNVLEIYNEINLDVMKFLHEKHRNQLTKVFKILRCKNALREM